MAILFLSCQHEVEAPVRSTIPFPPLRKGAHDRQTTTLGLYSAFLDGDIDLKLAFPACPLLGAGFVH